MSPRGPVGLLGSGEFEPWTSDLDRLLLERATARTGTVAIVPTASRCLFPLPGADLPTIWGDGLGPLRGAGLAVHAASRPPTWLEDVTSRAPVDVLSMDDGAALVLRPGRAPVQLGEGAIARYPAAAIAVARVTR